MPSAESLNHARSFLRKAEEYLDSARDNASAGRHTPAAGDAIHAGISAKDAIVTALTGATSKGRDHAAAGKELRKALGKRSEGDGAERALRDLLASKGDVEYGVALITGAKVDPLIRRASTLVQLAGRIVRLRG